jgi:hypothetical protein
MRHSVPSAALVTMLVTALATGCHHDPPRTAAAPAQSTEGHCWWAVYRTALPLDTVAVHFQRAYSDVGFSAATWTRTADTAWVHAGPTPLDRGPTGATYESRVVAYRRGDSTHFRHYVAIAAPLAGWAQPSDSENLESGLIPLCGSIGRAAAVAGWAPGRPDGEETLSVWRRRP